MNLLDLAVPHLEVDLSPLVRELTGRVGPIPVVASHWVAVMLHEGPKETIFRFFHTKR